MTLEWMAWTMPTAIFFITIATILVVMTIWQVKAPSGEHKGFLPISTTPGDRLFIGLLSSAFINLAWLGLTDFTLWISLSVALIWMAVLMKWG